MTSDQHRSALPYFQLCLKSQLYDEMKIWASTLLTTPKDYFKYPPKYNNTLQKMHATLQSDKKALCGWRVGAAEEKNTRQ